MTQEKIKDKGQGTRLLRNSKFLEIAISLRNQHLRDSIKQHFDEFLWSLIVHWDADIFCHCRNL